MEKYIKPETDIVCTDAFNDIADLSGDSLHDSVGKGQGVKGVDDWEDEADDFGW